MFFFYFLSTFFQFVTLLINSLSTYLWYYLLIHIVSHFCLIGERLHDVQVTIIGQGRNYPCGFFPGPAVTGDRIVILCMNGAIGSSVKIQIVSKEGQMDTLTFCEVEVFSGPWAFVRFSLIYILHITCIVTELLSDFH
jgi:hypothetical protein